MANDLNSIDYGFRPTGPGGAWMQGQEDLYTRAARQAQQEAAAQEAARKEQHDMALQKYYEAQAAAQQDAIKQRAETARDSLVLKNQQAKQLQDVNGRPLMQATVDLAGKPNEGMDMGKLVQAARMYNNLETQMPEAVQKALSTPRKYKDPQSGEVFESKFDPEAMAALTGSWQKDKNTTTLDKQGMIGGQNIDLEKERQRGRLDLQELKNAALAKIASEKDHNKARTWYQDFKQLDDAVAAGVPGADQRLEQFITNLQQTKPATLTNTITDTGIEQIQNRPQVQVAKPKTVDFGSLK
jgi:hypothetical protein